MFVQPRPKKSLLPPPSKKRKAVHSIDEIAFDSKARTEYLTGFHKRKQQRIKNAQEQAALKEKRERMEMRREIREQRKRQLEEHIRTVNDALRRAEAAGAIVEESQTESEWDGFADPPVPEFIDHEEEYIDEDKYTTVTVESVTIGRDGFHKPRLDSTDDDAEEEEKLPPVQETKKDGKRPPPKKRKKKFRH